MALPPLDSGAVQLTVADALPRLAVTPVGASGTATGVTAFDAADAVPVPALLVAVTVKVYDVPLVSPVTVVDSVVPPTVTTWPALDRTV